MIGMVLIFEWVWPPCRSCPGSHRNPATVVTAARAGADATGNAENLLSGGLNPTGGGQVKRGNIHIHPKNTDEAVRVVSGGLDAVVTAELTYD